MHGSTVTRSKAWSGCRQASHQHIRQEHDIVGDRGTQEGNSRIDFGSSPSSGHSKYIKKARGGGASELKKNRLWLLWLHLAADFNI